jgi:sulfide:quinone oxidoreductase
MKKPGVRLGEKALQMIDQMIAAFHIKKITGKKIDEFVKDGVILEDGEKIEADAVMFIPAVDGHSVIKKSDLPKNDAGFIIIDDTTQVEGLENIYAIGDAAEIVGPDWRAKQGHLAEDMARVCVS